MESGRSPGTSWLLVPSDEGPHGGNLEALPIPRSLHFLGGLSPSMASRVQIRSPRFSHLRMRSACSSSLALHLLLRIRRIASGDTSNCCARAFVELRSVSCECSDRIISIVSGESFLRGNHPASPNFFSSANFWIFQCSRARSGAPLGLRGSWGGISWNVWLCFSGGACRANPRETASFSRLRAGLPLNARL